MLVAWPGKLYCTGPVKVRSHFPLVMGLAFGILLGTTAVFACTWVYPIWTIQSDSADALFLFEQDGRAGYIDQRGRIVIKPILPLLAHLSGEFHEGLLGINEQTGYRYVDRSGRTVVRTNAWMAREFSEGLAPASIKTSATSLSGI
jgi:hypothetical protein